MFVAPEHVLQFAVHVEHIKETPAYPEGQVVKQVLSGFKKNPLAQVKQYVDEVQLKQLFIQPTQRLLVTFPKKVLGQLSTQLVTLKKYEPVHELQVLVVPEQVTQLAVHKEQTEFTEVYPEGHVVRHVLSGLREYPEAHEKQ